MQQHKRALRLIQSKSNSFLRIATARLHSSWQCSNHHYHHRYYATTSSTEVNAGELIQEVNETRLKLTTIVERLQVNQKRDELMKLNMMVQQSDFWDNASQAQSIMKRKSALENDLNFVSQSETEIENHLQLIEMATLEVSNGDERNEILNDVWSQLKRLTWRIDEKDIDSLFTDREDALNCYMELFPGAGGTESNDWAEMLLNMYSNWAKKNSFQFAIQNIQPGKVAGIKHATLLISGKNAYGWIKSENGVHRLVRQSPFNADNKRHTSFVGVTVYPEVDDTIAIDINPKDLKIETMRASGAGGQHVNKTESAIRITHEPTGIVVTCQDQRDQHQNRAKAMKSLHSKLYILEKEKQAQKKSDLFNNMEDASFGSQIRSYVLHPYHLVKDLRTNVECSDPDAFLAGDGDHLTRFMKEYLQWNLQRIRTD